MNNAIRVSTETSLECGIFLQVPDLQRPGGISGGNAAVWHLHPPTVNFVIFRTETNPVLNFVNNLFLFFRDASWEREDNAFEDLLFRHNRCDAKICNCSRGRNYDRDAS